MYKQRSFTLKPKQHKKNWFIVDAKNLVVGRMATKIADVLRGKTNPKYTPNTDSGNYVVVINSEKIKFTGNKWNDKKYYRHSGFVGGLKVRTASEQLQCDPRKIIFKAVQGMLPKNSLGREQLTKLKVFVGEEHSYKNHKPKELKI